MAQAIRTSRLAIFNIAIPVGSALGYIVGGQVAQALVSSLCLARNYQHRDIFFFILSLTRAFFFSRGGTM